MSRLLVTFLLCVCAAGPSFAHIPEKGKVYGSLGPYAHRSQLNYEFDDLDPSTMGGAIFIVEADVDRNGGIEISLGYLEKLFYREMDNSITVERAERFYVNVGYRHWWNKTFSTGLSVHTAYSMGSPDEVHVTGTRLQTTASSTAYNGLDLSFQADIPFAEDRFILTDFRYSYSFDFQPGEVSDHYGVIVAYKQRISFE